MELKKHLLSLYPLLFDSRGRVNSNIMRDLSTRANIEDLIKDHMATLSGEYKLSEKLLILFNDISTVSNRCEICQQLTTLDTVNKKFRPFCSLLCSRSNESSKYQKIKHTMISRYGVTSNLLLPHVIASRKEKYGGIGSGSTIISDKIKATNLSRYGVENAFASAEVKEKIKNTHLQKYNNRHYAQQHLSDELVEKLNNLEFCQLMCNDKSKTFSQYAVELGITTSTLLRYIRLHGLTIERKPASSLEYLISSMLDKVSIVHIRNSRSIISSEIDIFIPKFNVGIEINGLYWHSDSINTNKHNAIEKRKDASRNNIQLMTFFEHEVLEKYPIVESMILHKCQLSTKIFARKCRVQLLTSKHKTEFFKQTHIAGDATSLFNYGLVFNGEIVAAISIGKSRFNKDAPYEVIRYANKLNHTVVGGFSKLFAAVTTRHSITSCSTFADLRFCLANNIYKSENFTFCANTAPSYFYWKSSVNGFNILSRYQTQKKKLNKLLDNFDEEKTEYENMINAGWHRVWDCGNEKLIWKSQS